MGGRWMGGWLVGGGGVEVVKTPGARDGTDKGLFSVGASV